MAYIINSTCFVFTITSQDFFSVNGARNILGLLKTVTWYINIECHITATWLYVEGLDKSDVDSEPGEASHGRTGPQTPLGTGQWREE